MQFVVKATGVAHQMTFGVSTPHGRLVSRAVGADSFAVATTAAIATAATAAVTCTTKSSHDTHDTGIDTQGSRGVLASTATAQ